MYGKRSNRIYLEKQEQIHLSLETDDFETDDF